MGSGHILSAPPRPLLQRVMDLIVAEHHRRCALPTCSGALMRMPGGVWREVCPSITPTPTSKFTRSPDGKHASESSLRIDTTLCQSGHIFESFEFAGRWRDIKTAGGARDTGRYVVSIVIPSPDAFCQMMKCRWRKVTRLLLLLIAICLGVLSQGMQVSGLPRQQRTQVFPPILSIILTLEHTTTQTNLQITPGVVK